MTIISAVYRFFIAPIRKYPVSLVFLSLLIYYPEARWCFSADSCFEGAKRLSAALLGAAFNNLLITTAIAYIVVLVSYLFSKINSKTGIIVLGVFHVAIYFIVFTEIFLSETFGGGISAMMIKLFVETNPKEANDFLSTYLLDASFLSVLFRILIAVVFEFLMWSLYKYCSSRLLDNADRQAQHQTGCGKKVTKTTLRLLPLLKIPVFAYTALAVIYFVHLHPVFSHNWRQNYIFIEEHRIPWCPDCTERSFPWSVNLAIVQYLTERGDKDKCILSQNEVGGVKLNSPGTAPNLVLVIGESHSRHHSSMYGYPKPTTLSTDTIDGVCAWTDVITSVNVTAEAFQNMFSVASANDSVRWCDVPFFPAVFKKAGYNVVFWSNQFVSEVVMGNGDFSGEFFSHPKLRKSCFSHYNSEKCDFDGPFLNYYKDHRSKVENDSLNLVILHLAGQHVDPVTHFPSESAVFAIDDYAYRKELTKEEKQQVANYDNCTHYVDSVLSEIFLMYKEKDALVIYIPDHGDEANDYQSHIGRSYDLQGLGAPCLHCQFDIPFLFYASPLYREKHPEHWRMITTSKNRPFMTDDLPHLLFFLAGVETHWYRETLNPISVRYKSKNRIITNGIDYDSICRQYGKWQIGYKK